MEVKSFNFQRAFIAPRTLRSGPNLEQGSETSLKVSCRLYTALGVLCVCWHRVSAYDDFVYFCYSSRGSIFVAMVALWACTAVGGSGLCCWGWVWLVRAAGGPHQVSKARRAR